MNGTMWKLHTFAREIFGCGKIYCSEIINIISFVQTLVPNYQFENVFPTYFGIEISYQNSPMVLGNLSNTHFTSF
jgi:hypothetical protein